MNKLIKIGTHHTAEELQLVNDIVSQIKPSGFSTEVVTLPKSVSLESALLQGVVDIVVQHANEVTLNLAEEIELLAFTQRKPANDVWITNSKSINLRTAGAHVGAANKRIAAFLKHLNPEAKVFIINNIELELNNLLTGKHHALIIPADTTLPDAHQSIFSEPIETSYFVPSAGTGSLAVLCHKKLPFTKKEVIQRWVNHEETEDCIRTERSFLSAMEDHKNEIMFTYAHFEGALITLKAGIISADGQQVIKTKKSSTLADSKELGRKVAIEVLETAAAN